MAPLVGIGRSDLGFGGWVGQREDEGMLHMLAQLLNILLPVKTRHMVE